MQKLSINQWAEEDRPREKMMRLGAGALSNAELLAILIGSGSQDESAVDLMKRVLADCGNNLNTLGKMTIAELTDGRYKGLGPAKAVTVLAACELGKRRQREISSELKGTGVGTKAQQALKLQHEQNKTERKSKSREQKEAEKVRKYEQRQQKRREKHRGH